MSPNPSIKEIVLVGCPNFVVHENAFNNQPKMIVPTEINILLLLVNM